MFFEKFDKTIGKISTVFDKLSRIALLVLTVLCCANIISRLVWKPFNFTYDLMCLIATLVVSFSLPLCTMKKGHVAIDLVVSKLPAKAHKAVEIICGIIGIVIFALVDCWLIRYTSNSITNHLTSITNRIPYWPFAICITVSFIVFTVVLLNNLFNTFRKEVTK